MDRISRKARAALMAKIHSKHTSPEVALRKVLRKAGIRYRLHYSKEKIDIAIPSKKIAIFVDGCFWHMCPIHRSYPKTNKNYWIPKLERNVERDKVTNARLKKAGWTVMRFWEHDVNRRTAWCVKRIAAAYS